jgi:hypothetical protein
VANASTLPIASESVGRGLGLPTILLRVLDKIFAIENAGDTGFFFRDLNRAIGNAEKI